MTSDPSDSALDDSAGGAERSAIVLGLLNAVQADSAVTQRSLARELGIALGIANATLRRCVDKGLIKVRQAPARRYAYYLTPRGFAEKSRLTAEYLTDSFRFFRDARSQCEALLAGCAARGWRRIALAGAGELAEIVQLCSANAGVQLVAVIDQRQAGRTFGGLPVVGELAHVPSGAVDAVVVTDLKAPQANFDAMRASAAAIGFDADRILAPKLLRVSVAPPPADTETPA